MKEAVLIQDHRAHDRPYDSRSPVSRTQPTEPPLQNTRTLGIENRFHL